MSLPRQTAEASRRRAPRLEQFLITAAATGTGEFYRRASRLRSAPSCRSEYQKLGHVGKKKSEKNPRLSRAAWFAPAVRGCFFSLCRRMRGGSGRASAVRSGSGLAGLAGTLGRSGRPDRARLRRSDAGRSCRSAKKGFGLDPFQSTTVVRGKVGDDGHLSGSLVRQGPDHQDLSISFEGMAAGNRRDQRHAAIRQMSLDGDTASRLSDAAMR